MQTAEFTIESSQPASEESQTRTYYSRHGRLTLVVNPGTYQLDATNRNILIGHKMAEFSPVGNLSFGQLTTTDPETIQFMDRRMATLGDIFGPEKYNDLITPDAIKARNAMSENKRLISDNNRLILQLEQIKAELSSAKKRP